jgi:DNA polymerase-3 subunit delta'
MLPAPSAVSAAAQLEPPEASETSVQFGDFGQPHAERLGRDMLRTSRMVGSFLFDGPAGVGKEALALEVGRLLKCSTDGSCPPRGIFRKPPQKEAPAAEPEASQAEGCISCRKFWKLQHPDLHLVFPVPTGVWDKEPQAVREALDAKAQDPYFKPEFDRPAGIQADVIRDVVLPAVHRKPAEGKFKIVILSDADQMAFGVGNLLLKTLEEPPQDCLLVVTTAHPDRLLPTIRSRCQRVRFAPLRSDWMIPRLELLHEVKPAEARVAAGLSQGSMWTASRYFTGRLTELRDLAFEIWAAGAECDVLQLLEHASRTSTSFSKNRHLYPFLLHLLAVIGCDAMRVISGADVEPVNADRRKEIERLARDFGLDDLRRLVRRIEAAERQIAGYVHAELTLDTVFLDMARDSEAGRAMAGRK